MEDFDELTEIIRNLPSVHPSADFTSRVMSSIIDTKKGFCFSLLDYLTRRRTFLLDPVRALRGQADNQEFFVYSVMIAVAHLIFALVLLMGYRNMPYATLLPPIMILQPWIFLFLACLLSYWGFLMKRNDLIDRRIARVTNFIYIEVAVVNGVLLIIQFKNIFLLVPFIFTIAATSVAAGIFLALICEAAGKKMNEPENYLHA